MRDNGVSGIFGAGRQPDETVWAVGALCQAIAQSLDQRFNPIRVAGEVSGFSRAASGHCYFSLKDVSGQLRCAMFRRAASTLTQLPRDGDWVEVHARLGVYEARGELQLIVENLRRAGQGTLFEQFLERKARLEKEGLFDAGRKKPVPALPRGIGIVTSPGAAALHDVLTALQRRAPHLPVVLVGASVQGEQSAAELVRALNTLYAFAVDPRAQVPIDAILLVRGGGALEDLWSFNDELLARTIAQSPVPVIAGIGHETDFTIADFVADLRAPTPTAAAEMVSISTQAALDALREGAARLQLALQRQLDRQAQKVDRLASRIGRLSGALERQQTRLQSAEQSIRHAMQMQLQQRQYALQRQAVQLPDALHKTLTRHQNAIASAQVRLHSLNPALVLQRGYAWLSDETGRAIGSVAELRPGQALQATLQDGAAKLEVLSTHPV